MEQEYARLNVEDPETTLLLSPPPAKRPRRSDAGAGEPLLENASTAAMIRDGFLKELFRKELTPSDVGKLNRLVIPKKHALSFFPEIETLREGAMLEFGDAEGRKWHFRYCYWKSSQSFVFTKGWNKFVRANRLRSKDVVIFYGGEERDGFPSFYVIDVSRHQGAEELAGGEEEENVEAEEIGNGSMRESSDAVAMEAEHWKKPFQLFGVQITDF